MLLQQIVNGLALGSIYALIALGFSIIYKSRDILNLAHGDMMMISAFVAFVLMTQCQLPLVVAYIGVFVFAIFMGYVLDRLIFRPLMGYHLFPVVMATISVGIILKGLAGLVSDMAIAGTRGVSDTEVRIGIVPDLSGPSANGVRKYVWALERYLQEVNRGGGIHGRKIVLFIQDGKYNPSIALSAFKKLVLKNRVFAMVANTGSGMVKAQLPLIEKYHVPLVSPAVQSGWMSNPPNKYIFATMLSMGYCARVLIDYLVRDLGEKRPRIGVCYMNTEMGQEALREIKDHTSRYDFEIVTEISFTPGSIDLSGQMAKLKTANVDYVMVCAINKGSAYACKEAAKLDWKPQFMFPGVGSSEHIFALGREAMFYGKPPIGAAEYLPVSVDSEAKRLCLKWMEQEGLDQKKLVTKTLYGVTYGKTLVEGLKLAGRDLTAENFIKAMERIENFDNGAQAPVTFGTNNRQGVTKVVVYRGVPGGKDHIGRWEIVKNWTEPRRAGDRSISLD